MLHFTSEPWLHVTTAQRIAMSALHRKTSAQLSEQLDQPHLIAFYCCTVPQLYHIISHPPTQTVIAGGRSIRITTTFDVLVRYSWCSGWETTQWLGDLRENPPTRPPTLFDIRHKSVMFTTFLIHFIMKVWILHVFFVSCPIQLHFMYSGSGILNIPRSIIVNLVAFRMSLVLH